MESPPLTPDATVLFELGPLAVNATIAFTWLLMVLLIVPAWLITRRLAPDPKGHRVQLVLEAAVSYARQEVREIAGTRAGAILPFTGTLLLFIGLSNILAIVPGWQPPTASLSTTAALAIAVLVAVPAYGVAMVGVGTYLRHYIEPTPIMLPFRIIGELSRTLALAVRLFGNMMSAQMVVAVLLLVIPLLLPAVLEALGLLTGVIQAYIFAVLATVYIASGMEASEEPISGQADGGESSEATTTPEEG